MTAAVTTPQFFTIRPGRSTDTAYIVEWWYSSSRWNQDGGPHYRVELMRHVTNLLSRPSTEVRIAADREDDDAIHGWAVVSDVQTLIPRIHYIFVRESSQRLGVASTLLRDLFERPCVYTSRPYACRHRHLDSSGCQHQTSWLRWVESHPNEKPDRPKPERCLWHSLPKPPGWSFSLFAGFEP